MAARRRSSVVVSKREKEFGKGKRGIKRRSAFFLSPRLEFTKLESRVRMASRINVIKKAKISWHISKPVRICRIPFLLRYKAIESPPPPPPPPMPTRGMSPSLIGPPPLSTFYGRLQPSRGAVFFFFPFLVFQQQVFSLSLPKIFFHFLGPNQDQGFTKDVSKAPVRHAPARRHSLQ